MRTTGQAPASPESTPWYLNYRAIFAPFPILFVLAMIPGGLGHLAARALAFYAPAAFLEMAVVMTHAQKQKEKRSAGS